MRAHSFSEERIELPAISVMASIGRLRQLAALRKIGGNAVDAEYVSASHRA
jgi:hypothetical protein